MSLAAVLKSALKATLPLQPQLRRIKRRLRPYRDNPENSRYALQQGLHLIRLLETAGTDLNGEVLELGTGWLPIIPLLFHLAGARRLVLTDQERLMDRHTVARARGVIHQNLPTIAQALGRSEGHMAARLATDFALEYLVPWDSMKHPARSADIVFSRAVLEHVPPDVLDRLFADFSRILRPGGAMCHTIDNSDHWEHRNKKLSRVNFLRHEEGLYWRLACFNPQAYQNRLRHSDYIALFVRHGWTTVVADGVPDERCLHDLATLPLGARFRGRDYGDLAILTSTFVLRRQAHLPHTR
jgi:SAM-dependent methyltransferase